MSTQTSNGIYKSLRAAEILIAFICFILEIVEYAAFREFHDELGFSLSSYFSAGIAKSTKDDNIVYYNGTKVLYYIVLIMTLVDSGFYLSRFCSRAIGPVRRDISINAFFMTLWIASGIANIYPAFSGYGYTCDPNLPDAIARECNAKVFSISLGWINGFLFFLTTLMALKLWTERQERYEGERRVEALGEVVYKYKPRPNTIVQVDEPEQVMIFSKKEMRRGSSRSSHLAN